MTRCSTLTTYQKKGGNIKFPGFLLLGVSTVLIILLSCRSCWPEYHLYIFRIIASKTILALIGGFAGFMLVWFLTLDISGHYLLLRRVPRILGFYFGVFWAVNHWDQILLYLEGMKAGYPDPVLKKDAAFYLFNLPFYEDLFVLLFSLVAVSLVGLFIWLFLQAGSKDIRRQGMNRRDRLFQYRYNGVYINVGLLLFLLAWGRYLERYDRLYWQLGPSFDMGSANAPVLLSSLNMVFVAMIIGSLFLVFPLVRRRLPFHFASKFVFADQRSQANPHLRLIRYALGATLFIVWNTAPQGYQSQVIQTAGIASHALFSGASESGRLEFGQKNIGTYKTGLSMRQAVIHANPESFIIVKAPLAEKGS
jgi:hypothetical protein